MSRLSPTPTVRTRLGVGLAMACLALVAGCGNDISQAEDATTTSVRSTLTTEATGGDGTSTTSEAENTTTTTRDDESTSDGAPTEITLPTGITLPTDLTLPDGTELTLPDGADLTVPDGLGDCVEAGGALANLNLALLGSTSVEQIDDSVKVLERTMGSASKSDIEVVAKAARKAAESGGLSAEPLSNDGYTKANEALTNRLTELCGVG